MEFKISKVVAEEYVVMHPYQYYVHPGEILYRFWNNDFQKSYFIHVNEDGLVLFHSKELVEFKNIKDIKNIEEKDSDLFYSYFFEMSCRGFEDEDFRFYDDLEKIRKYTKKDPIVIGGCGRSGTTLLLSILGSHKNIYSMDEETYAFCPKPYRLSKVLNMLDGVKFNKEKRWCEKTPLNVLFFRKIYDLFDKKVKLINIVRDGRSVVTSVHPNHKGHFWVDVERWVESIDAGLKYQDISYTVKYEDLVLYPHKTIDGICDFIGESFEESMMDYDRKTTVKNNVAWKGNATPISSNRIDGWKNEKYNERVSSFMENEYALKLMKKLGYI